MPALCPLLLLLTDGMACARRRRRHRLALPRPGLAILFFGSPSSPSPFPSSSLTLALAPTGSPAARTLPLQISTLGVCCASVLDTLCNRLLSPFFCRIVTSLVCSDGWMDGWNRGWTGQSQVEDGIAAEGSSSSSAASSSSTVFGLDSRGLSFLL
ncbi:hypothetical protein TYRP_002817 [Tyrophagus putrescentiae]|nr:hypothetical protein TYRP_002817 [Tyrophagus putrescentiae]